MRRCSATFSPTPGVTGYSTSDLVERLAQHGAPETAGAAPDRGRTLQADHCDRPDLQAQPRSITPGITLEETLIGFLIGATLGVGLAVVVVFVKPLERSLMPWIVASQTVPIIALAPMIVVILNQFDIGGMTPKAVIAAYLSFFPITVGMVKGLRSPDPLQLDLMRTYSATPAQTLSSCARPPACRSSSPA